MLRMLRNHFIAVWVGLLFVFPHATIHAQETSRTSLKSYLIELEKQHDIKFSYVDEDLEGVEVAIPADLSLDLVLEALETQTQIKIRKINERYYSLVKNTLVSVCGKVLDNFAENTVPGATVEVMDSDIALVTDIKWPFSN